MASGEAGPCSGPEFGKAIGHYTVYHLDDGRLTRVERGALGGGSH